MERTKSLTINMVTWTKSSTSVFVSHLVCKNFHPSALKENSKTNVGNNSYKCSEQDMYFCHEKSHLNGPNSIFIVNKI